MEIKYVGRVFMTIGLVCVVVAFLLLEWGSYYLQGQMLAKHEQALSVLVKQNIDITTNAIQTYVELAKQNKETIATLNKELLVNRKLIHDNLILILRLKQELAEANRRIPRPVN